MPKIRLSNRHSDKAVVVWVEPWAEDYWMQPGDEFTIEYADDDFDENIVGDAHFEVSWVDDGIVVWTASRNWVAVRDRSGAELACGYQRPVEE